METNGGWQISSHRPEGIGERRMNRRGVDEHYQNRRKQLRTTSIPSVHHQGAGFSYSRPRHRNACGRGVLRSVRNGGRPELGHLGRNAYAQRKCIEARQELPQPGIPLGATRDVYDLTAGLGEHRLEPVQWRWGRLRAPRSESTGVVDCARRSLAARIDIKICSRALIQCPPATDLGTTSGWEREPPVPASSH